MNNLDGKVKNDAVKGLVILFVGFLQSLLAFFSVLNIEFEWFTNESINLFGAVITAFALFVLGIVATWKNTFISKKARIQNEELHRKNLK